MTKNTFVIAIAGASGSGKSSIVREVAKSLGGAILYYDDYSQFQKWPETNGPNDEILNLKEVKLTKLVEDLQLLQNWQNVVNPRNGQEIKAAEYIIIEDPHGRERLDIGKEYDYVVLIDTPLEICLSRVILRAFAEKYFQKPDGTVVLQEEGDPKEKLVILDNFVFGPYWTRDYYFNVNKIVRKNADLIVDGLGTIEEIAQEIVEKIKTRKK